MDYFERKIISKSPGHQRRQITFEITRTKKRRQIMFEITRKKNTFLNRGTCLVHFNETGILPMMDHLSHHVN